MDSLTYGRRRPVENEFNRPFRTTHPPLPDHSRAPTPPHIAIMIPLLLVSWVTIITAFRPTSPCQKSKLRMEVFEGNPIGKKMWNFVWELPFMKVTTQGTSPTAFGDAANVLKKNIEQIYGGEPSYDGAPVAEGEVSGILDGALFLGLQDYYRKFGGSYKLLFGPKSFIVISDPIILKHILRDVRSHRNFCFV